MNNKKIVSVVGVSMSVYHILYLARVLERLRIFIDPIQHMCVSLAFLLCIVFLTTPKMKGLPKNKIMWNDLLFIVLGVPFPVYLFFVFGEKQMSLGIPNTVELILGTMLIIALIDAAARTVGWFYTGLVLAFVVEPFFCHVLPGMFHCGGFSFDRVVGVLTQEPSALFGVSFHVAAGIVMAFVIFSSFLEVSGAGEFFIKVAICLVGRVTGGTAKIAAIASALFGMVSGNAAANIVATGTFTIPLMKGAGYKDYFAGAVEGVAGTGGQLMPPVMGAAAFMMAEWLEIPYAAVCIAAAIPAALYYFCLYMMVDLEARKHGIGSVSEEHRLKLGEVMRTGWQNIIPIIVFGVFLLVLDWSPEMSALIGAAVILLCSMFRKETRMGTKQILLALEKSARGMATIGIACATVGFVIGSITLTGLGFRLSTDIVKIAGGNLWVLLLLTGLASTILGMGLPTIACYLILAVTIVPALTTFGVMPIAAHMFVFYFGLAAFITPPVCVPTYVAAGIAGSPPLKTAFKAMQLGIVAYTVPFIFVFEPAILMKGDVSSIVIKTTACTLMVITFAAAFTGYLFKRTSLIQRITLFVAGVMIFYPAWRISDIMGSALLCFVAMWQWIELKSLARRKVLDVQW